MIDILPSDRDLAMKVRSFPFIFPDSGIALHLQRVAPDTLTTIQRAIRKDRPPPAPPTQAIEYPDGSVRMEQNEAHPDHERALAEYHEEVAIETADRLMRLIARRADIAVDAEAVRQFREDMESIGAPVEETDDKVVYFRHICISSDNDYRALTDFIQRRSQPTEAAVQEHRESFRGDV